MAAKRTTEIDAVTAYANDVIAKRIPAGELVRAACRRHVNDLKASKRKAFPFKFRADLAKRAVDFLGFMSHFKGPMSGQQFRPLPWQMFVIGSIFGWVKKATGKRRFRKAYIEIPRKNGKTFLAAGVALYLLMADGEGGAEIYAAATKKEQARLVYDDARKIAKKSPTLKKHVTESYGKLHFERLDAKFEPLAADSKKLDGLNPSGAIIDEFHEHPDGNLLGVIEDGMGARDQPLVFIITTAGFNPASACYEMNQHCEAILTQPGFDQDDLFAFIASVDKKDRKKWSDPKVWAAANPSLGEAKTIEYMEALATEAQLRPSLENKFKNKQLNIWTQAAEKWLDLDKWDLGDLEIDEAELAGSRAFLGLDLSSKIDMTCAALVFPPGVYPEWTLLPRFYYPKENLRERSKELRAPLEKWADEGFLTLTPGDLIDLEFILEDIRKIGERFELVEIGFDPWKAIELATKLEQDGFDMVQMRQGHATLAAPTSAFEDKVARGQFRHGGNPVLRWQAGHVTTRPDANQNIVPDKSNNAQKIDGIVAAVMGLGRAMVNTEDASRYETDGIRTL